MNTTPSFTDTLRQRWQAADSMLCVGLDPDPARIPAANADRKSVV